MFFVILKCGLKAFSTRSVRIMLKLKSRFQYIADWNVGRWLGLRDHIRQPKIKQLNFHVRLGVFQCHGLSLCVVYIQNKYVYSQNLYRRTFVFHFFIRLGKLRRNWKLDDPFKQKPLTLWPYISQTLFNLLIWPVKVRHYRYVYESLSHTILTYCINRAHCFSRTQEIGTLKSLRCSHFLFGCSLTEQ